MSPAEHYARGRFEPQAHADTRHWGVMLTWIMRLDRWFSSTFPECYDTLQPPASDQEIASLEACLGFGLPDELCHLFRWRDGQPLNPGYAFYYNFSLMSLDLVGRVWRIMRDNQPNFPSDDWWSTNWIPFLHGGGSDFICVDCGGAFGGVRGQLISYVNSDEERLIEYPSVGAWGECFADSLEAGYWVPQEHGNLAAVRDYEQFRATRCHGYPLARYAAVSQR